MTLDRVRGVGERVEDRGPVGARRIEQVRTDHRRRVLRGAGEPQVASAGVGIRDRRREGVRDRDAAADRTDRARTARACSSNGPCRPRCAGCTRGSRTCRPSGACGACGALSARRPARARSARSGRSGCPRGSRRPCGAGCARRGRKRRSVGEDVYDEVVAVVERDQDEGVVDLDALPVVVLLDPGREREIVLAENRSRVVELDAPGAHLKDGAEHRSAAAGRHGCLRLGLRQLAQCPGKSAYMLVAAAAHDPPIAVTVTSSSSVLASASCMNARRVSERSSMMSRSS